jgi:hypothetical protein
MTVAKLFCLSLMTGALVFSAPAFAQSKKDPKADAKKASEDKIKEGKRRLGIYKGEWDNNVTPWLVHGKSNPSCLDKKRECLEIKTATKMIGFAAKNANTIPCDPSDSAKTLPNEAENTFKGRGQAEANSWPAFKLTVSTSCASGGTLDVTLTPSYYNK